jgi:uncharacterized membrane protein (DUF441 family)
MSAMRRNELSKKRCKQKEPSTFGWLDMLLAISFLISLISILSPWMDGKIEISQIVDSWLSLILAIWCTIAFTLLVIPRICRMCGL